MKTAIIAIIMFLSVGLCNVQASSPPWGGDGHYTFGDEDPFFPQGSIFDFATVEITGGSFGELGCYQESTVNMIDGIATIGFAARDNSTINLYGGSIYAIDILDSPNVNLFVDSYIFNPDSFLGWDQVAGTWLNDNGNFDILIREGQFQYINIVPEPCTVAVLALGGLLLRK